MKKKSIVLSLVPLMAAALVGCGGAEEKATHQQVCVDKNQKVLEDSACKSVPHAHTAGGGGIGSNPFFWMWLMSRPGGYPVGYAVPRGQGFYSAPTGAGVRVATGRSATTVRSAGFGSTASSSAGS